MANEKIRCPICGAAHDLNPPVPLTMICSTCQSAFSPSEEVPRYALYICKPGQHRSFLESHYSGSPFILLRQDDAIVSKKIRLKKGEALRVTSVEFEFEKA
jgi:hypothetical protein